jgi:hypothetical protein
MSNITRRGLFTATAASLAGVAARIVPATPDKPEGTVVCEDGVCGIYTDGKFDPLVFNYPVYNLTFTGLPDITTPA